MRILVVAMLALTVLAGCAENTADESGDDPMETMVEPTVPSVDGQELLTTLKMFGETWPLREDNLPDHEASRVWLLDTYAAMGYQVWHQHFQPANGLAQQNICAYKPGKLTHDVVVVGGHYDMTTTGGDIDRSLSQGMYDDGSGTIMTLKLAEAFVNVTLDYSVFFCAFDGEERGLQGSGAVATALYAEEEGGHEDYPQETPWGNMTIRAMLDLDMIGLNWPANEAPIYFDNNSPDLVEFVQGYAAELGIPDDKIEYHGIVLGRSDYAHFFARGTPTGFMISDFDKWTLPTGQAAVPQMNVDCTPVPSPVGIACAYPFWHHLDTWDTMVLMGGGSEAQMLKGFQTATDLAAGVIFHMAASQDTVLTGQVK